MRMGDRSMLSNPVIRFLLNRRSAFFRNRPRDPTAMLQMFIGRVDNCIHLFRGDVALHNLNGLTSGERVFRENGIHVNIVPR